MKHVVIIILFLSFSMSLLSQKFDIYKGDTINVVDENDLKQGLWIFFNAVYSDSISQKGFYKDNKKDGLWTSYYKTGKIKSEVTFKRNRQYGIAKSYYSSGQIQESGYWKTNKWVGEYIYYYENGQAKYHWFFDDDGKRTGIQDYYYDNGQAQITGEWVQGAETGVITQYYPNGNTKKVSNFTDGALNGSMTEYYADGQVKTKSIFINGHVDPSQNYAYQHKNSNNNSSQNNNSTTSQDSTQGSQYRVFNGNGYYKFVNDKGQVEREGNFVNGTLVTGKRYIYNTDGVLVKTVIIENSRVVQTINN